MSVFHAAVADDDILGWFVPETTVVVSSALDGDAVVACVEDTVLDEYILACLRVASVSVRSFVPNSYAVYRDVLAEQRVHHPERRVDHLYVLDEDALRAYEVDELRTEPLSHTELTLIKRHAVFCHFLQSGAGAHLLVFLGYALLVSEVRVAVPLPPCIIVAASVDGTFTGKHALVVQTSEGSSGAMITKLSGGTYSTSPESSWIEAGYEAKGENGTWTVQVKGQPGGETGTQVGAVKGFTLSVPNAEGAPYFDLTIQKPDNEEGIERYILYGKDATGKWKQLNSVSCSDNGTIEFYKLVGLKANCTQMKIVSKAAYGTNYRDNEAVFACNITVADNTESVATTAAFTKDENDRYSIALTGEVEKLSTAVFSNTGDAGDVLFVLTGMRDSTYHQLSEEITGTTYYCIYEYSDPQVNADGVTASVTIAKNAWNQVEAA